MKESIFYESNLYPAESAESQVLAMLTISLIEAAELVTLPPFRYAKTAIKDQKTGYMERKSCGDL